MPTKVGTHDKFQWDEWLPQASDAPRVFFFCVLPWIPAVAGMTVRGDTAAFPKFQRTIHVADRHVRENVLVARKLFECAWQHAFRAPAANRAPVILVMPTKVGT